LTYSNVCTFEIRHNQHMFSDICQIRDISFRSCLSFRSVFKVI